MMINNKILLLYVQYCYKVVLFNKIYVLDGNINIYTVNIILYNIIDLLSNLLIFL